MQLRGGHIREGVWQGTLGGSSGAPDVEMVQGTRVLPGLTVAPEAEGWSVRVPVPATAISDGVLTFLLRDRASGEVLGHFTLIAGVTPQEDIRAEIDLLRAEIDMLKRAFRRQGRDAPGDA